MENEENKATLTNIFNDYKESKFYEKYEDTYYSDSIIKNLFDETKKKHRIRLKNKTYLEIYKNNIQVMGDFLSLYYDKAKFKDDYRAWLMIYSMYIDPDSFDIKVNDGVECTVDGLLSLRRIYKYNGLTKEMIEEYKIYRENPIIYFPKENHGINQSRASVFGDRIDHTLFDIKKYYEAREECKMKDAYNLPKTSQWLTDMKNFKNIIDWLNVKGIFTNENYEVYNLEKNDGSIITDYLPSYSYEWTDTYYNNIKQKIEIYNKNKK